MTRLERAALAFAQAEILYHEAARRDEARGLFTPGDGKGLVEGTESYEAARRLHVAERAFRHITRPKIAAMRDAFCLDGSSRISTSRSR
jgi:hypothetical protein